MNEEIINDLARVLMSHHLFDTCDVCPLMKDHVNCPVDGDKEPCTNEGKLAVALKDHYKT